MTSKFTWRGLAGLRDSGQTVRDDWTDMEVSVLVRYEPMSLEIVLTTDHPASSYGIPVMLIDDDPTPLGPCDITHHTEAWELAAHQANLGNRLALAFCSGALRAQGR